MTSANARALDLPAGITQLRFSCPECREPVEHLDGLVAEGCKRCGFQARKTAGVLSFMPRATAYDWQEFYEAKAGGLEGNTTSGVGYSFTIQHRYMIEAFRRVCGQPGADAAILDVGCGNGLFWQSLFGNQAAVGVDFSLRMCALAQTRGMAVFQCDASALPFAGEQFDLIYSAEVIQHVDDLPALLAELARVCRPGGRIVISTLNRPSWYRRGYFFARGLVRGGKTAHRKQAVMRTAAELAELAGRHALSVGKVCWTHFPAPWIHCTTTTSYALEPLASNFVIELVKPAGPRQQ